jgi:hypothetical protein
MIAKRIGAVVVALVLIAAAIVVRDRIDAGDAEATVDDVLLVCATELVDACRDVADVLDSGQLRVVESSDGATLDALASANAEPALWLTYAPLPQMLNELRNGAGLEPITFTANEIATSPIAAIVRNAAADEVVELCGDPIDLGCIGSQTDLRPAVSSTDSGIGLLSIGAAMVARSDGAVDTSDIELTTWARSLQREIGRWGLGDRSAVVAMQTLTPMRVAIGAEAELVAAQRDNFRVIGADPMVRARVVLVRPEGSAVPDGLPAALSEALIAGGWDPVDVDEVSTEPDATTMLRVRTFWAGLS